MTATATRTSTTSTGSGGSGRGRPFLIGFLVLGVLVAGAVVLKDQIPGLQSEPASVLPATALDDYESFWNQHPEGAPPEFSVDRMRKVAEDCMISVIPYNTPQYLNADQYGRARGGYVCLWGEQVAATDLRCPAPGTNLWRQRNGMSPRSLFRVVEGHIIGKALGGDGSATLNGACVNLVPQSATPNSQMGVQAEQHAKGLAETVPFKPFLYFVVPFFTGTNYMPDGMGVFIISTQKSEAIGPFINESFNITDVGGAP